MCGIAGFIDFTSKSTQEILVGMTDVLHHRGPDDSGYFFYQQTSANVGLGHRRLSILDLSTLGRQPMEFENLVLIFNGEIYNFKEIHVRLENYGYSFISGSDTEVILKAYHKWGLDCIHHFIGMFSFVIYDKDANKLIMVRDRAGIKPLFWYYKNGLFMFASELKSFHKHPDFVKEINFDALALFFKYGYIPEPHSIFHHTRKLMAGHFLVIDTTTGQIDETEYWNVLEYYNKPKLNICETEAIEETERLLKSSCEYRMVADVPVGVFLSGGYDSSAVTAILQSGRTERLKTFSIGFHEERYNEAPFAKQVATCLGTDHTEYYCTQKDALEIIPLLPDIWDEPFGDSSSIPTALVSRMARKHVTVSLSADGGDEVFAGYGKYSAIRKKIIALSLLPGFTKPVLRAGLKSKVVQSMAECGGMSNAVDRMNTWALMITADEKALLPLVTTFSQLEIDQLFLKPHRQIPTNFDAIIHQDWLSNLLALDYKTFLLDDILAKVDRATMSTSLEGREPLLDHRLIEFAAQLPGSYKIRGNEKKWILKEIVHKYIPQVVMQRPKMGFVIPIFEWFKDELKDYLVYYLNEKRIAHEGLFNPILVNDIRTNHLSGRHHDMQKLWLLLMFEMWFEKWG